MWYRKTLVGGGHCGGNTRHLPFFSPGNPGQGESARRGWRWLGTVGSEKNGEDGMDTVDNCRSHTRAARLRGAYLCQTAALPSRLLELDSKRRNSNGMPRDAWLKFASVWRENYHMRPCL